jgi:membrane associated rhomboid family serine protease
MTTTPVGMRCPDCSRQKTKVRTASTLTGTPQLTYALIAINAIAYVLTSGGSTGPSGDLYSKGVLFGPLVADGEWWRIITSGFLHAGIVHIVLNMVFLWFLGTMLEPAIGKLRFGTIYLVSLVGGSFGALLLTPNDSTVGASGAVFGLMGAAILFMRTRGIGVMQSGLGLTLILNLVLTFRPGISFGGHLGGLLAGGVLGYLMFEVAERRKVSGNLVYGVSAAMILALAVGAVLVAQSAAPPSF